ncbi:MAG: DUF2812 domain-containing protein [Bryobacteraceae bacterium]|nr:DUF2812 domain-containing protein [Bryobacteraceae bacterium]
MGDAATITRLRFFTAWNAEAEERWLEQMARQGWHLTRGGILFKFRQGAPSMVRYRLDYRSETGTKLREYLDLCRDAGYEHVYQFASWHYFRTSDPAAPELHTDPASLADSYKRILALLAFILLVNLPFILSPPRHSRLADWSLVWFFINSIRLFLVVVLGYGIIRMAIRIRELRAKSTRHML